MRFLFFPLAVYSIALDGSTEYFLNQTDNTFGIVDDWSISLWCLADSTTLTQSDTVFRLKVSNNNRSEILWTLFGVTGSEFFQIQLRKSNGQFLKRYRWNEANIFPTADVWVHLLATWNGTTGDVLKLYINGTDTAADSTVTDTTGEMSDPGRQMSYGADTVGTGNWGGNVGHLAMWNTVLGDSEVTEIFNGKFNISLRSNSGPYISSSALQHYWRPGSDRNDIGKDEGFGSTKVDIMQNAANITVADIDTNIP